MRLLKLFYLLPACLLLTTAIYAQSPIPTLLRYQAPNSFIPSLYEHGLTSDNNRLIAVLNGAIYTSIGGRVWNQIPSTAIPIPGLDISTFMTSVSYGNGRFVIGSQSYSGYGYNDFITSPDGLTWTLGTYHPTAPTNAVAYLNGQFVAVGNKGQLLTSPDGLTWAQRPTNRTEHIRGVCYGSGLYIACGANGLILTSPDGITWTKPASLNSTTDLWAAATNGTGTYVVVGASNTILSSTDAGQTWTDRNLQNNLTEFFGIVYANGLFVAIDRNSYVYTSSDGITWSRSQPCPDTNLAPPFRITYANGQFVVVGGRYTMTSPDGLNWQFYNSDATDATIAFGRIWVSGRHIANTTDGGGTWTASLAPVSQFYRSMVAGPDKLVALAFLPPALGSLNVATSPNGVNWTTTPTNLTVDATNGLAYGNGYYVAVGTGGSILTSTDGTTWATQPNSTTQTLNHVTFRNTMFVAVGINGTILTSTNGTTWATRPTPATATLNGIQVDNTGLFVAVGKGGTLLTSSDGLTWTQRIVPTTQNLNAVTVSPTGIWTVVGDNGTWLTSTTGTGSWVKSPAQTANSFRTVIADTDGNVVALGDNNTVVSTYPRLVSVRNGAWNDPTTWAGARVPTLTDQVEIRHIVTIPGLYQAKAYSLRISYGFLTYGANGRLLLGQ